MKEDNIEEYDYDINPFGIGTKVNLYGWVSKPIEQRKLVYKIMEDVNNETCEKIKELKKHAHDKVKKELYLNGIEWLI